MSGTDSQKEVADDYKCALADLHVNSKPLITFLTMLADENKNHASVITQVVTNHIKTTTYKLPAMYLVDSIVKNVGDDYKRLFGNLIANIFTGVFKEVDEKTRKKLYELRQTWNEVFPKSRLFHLDTNIHEIDPAWPITSQPRIGAQPSTIHVNPNKFKPHALKSSGMTKLPNLPSSELASTSMTNTQDIEELQKLQTEKRVLEETRKKVEKMMKEKETTETPAKVIDPSPTSLSQDRQAFLRNYKIKKKSQPSDDKHTSSLPSSTNEKAPNIYIAPWKAKQILPNITTPPSTLPSTPKDPRISSVSRDPRLSHVEAVKEPKIEMYDPHPPKPQRDPRPSAVVRESGPSHRDPRLANKSSATSVAPLKAGTAPTPKPSPVSVSKSCTASKTSAPISSSNSVNASAPVISLASTPAVTVASLSHTLPTTVKDPRLPPPEAKKPEKEKDRVEKHVQGKTKKEKEFLKGKDSDSKKEKDRHKEKEKEKTKPKEREKDKKKQPETKLTFKTSHEREEEESKARQKREIKNKKDGKDKAKIEKVSPKESSKSNEQSSKNSGRAKHDQSSSPTCDKFKPKNDGSGRTKRSREHIRPRIESPVEETKPECPKEPIVVDDELDSANENTSATTVIIGNGNEECVKTVRDSDSEDSDHYDANKPQPSLYTNKKEPPTAMNMPETTISEVNAFSLQQAQSEAVSSTSTSSANHAFESQAIDTDMRQLSSQQERIPPPPPVKQNDEIVELPSNKVQCLGLGLFGKEDVDLRQLAMPTHFPGHPNNPAGAINPFLGKPDEDMRIPPDPRKTPAFRDSQNPRVAKVIDDDRREYLKSPRREDSLLSDMGARKASFNSPHAAKWEKFREKNPEFKEYERQASSSEKMEMEGEIIELDDKSHPFRDGRGLNRRGRVKDSRRPYRDGHIDDFRGRERRSASPLEGHPRDENYQYMINQLNDQLKRGEISHNEFGRCMENIRLMVEQGKIRELQAKEGRWSPGVRPRESRGAGSWNRQFSSESDRHVEKFHGNKGEGKWIEGGSSKIGGVWQRGRGLRGGPPTSGFHGNYRSGGGVPHHPRFEDDWTGDPDLPTITDDVLRTVFRESETRTIDIDGRPREIRTYGERAIILMDWNEPRRISFEAVQCDIVFDGGELVLPMRAGESHREFIIDGETHRVKLGVPTQELLIDGKGYQCFFGGKPITVHLAGKNRIVSLQGRPPKVNIGTIRDNDYLLGKIELIINAKKIIPLYLDAKPQRFTIDGMPFVIKFIDSFLAATINGVRFPVIFGGLPISISVRGYRRFLRFSNLPAGVIPGKTSVKGMDADGNSLIPSYPPSPPLSVDPPMVPQFNPPPLLPAGVRPPPMMINTPSTNFPAPTPSKNTFPQGPPPPYPPQDNLKMPLGVVPMGPPPLVGIVPGSYLTNAEGTAAPSLASLPPVSAPGAAPPAVPQTPSGSQSSSIDVQGLLDRLVKTGIIGGGTKKEVKKEGTKEGKEEKEDKTEEEEEDLDDLKDLPPLEVMFNLDNLRKRNDKLIKRMYRGMQCSSCGLRYPPEQTQQYSHHLDWHFRMNKKQQESTKKVNTRKFYLCFEDWIQYEEIEDLEERVPSMFEVEGQLNTKALESEDDDGEEEIPSIAVSSDNSLGVCPICHETFDQFYHHNTEEWHYKYAIQVEGINYHPACHQDFIKIQKQEEERLKKEAEEKEKESEDPVEIKEDDVELEELKIEDEEIQEIEKEVDTKPKEEIDLTAEDDKIEEPDPDDPAIRKQEKVTEALQKMRLLSNGLPPSYRIKEEPLDAEVQMKVVISKGPGILSDIPVKVEIEEEEDSTSEPPAFDIDDDDLNENELGETPNESWIAPAPLGTAHTDIASSIDGNTELLTNTETSEPVVSVPKIKISVSIPTQNNIEDQLNANNNNSSAHTDGEDSINTNNHIEEFVPPPFTVDLELKPAFRGVCLLEQPIAHRGVEISSLCSIM